IRMAAVGPGPVNVRKTLVCDETARFAKVHHIFVALRRFHVGPAEFPGRVGILITNAKPRGLRFWIGGDPAGRGTGREKFATSRPIALPARAGSVNTQERFGSGIVSARRGPASRPDGSCVRRTVRGLRRSTVSVRSVWPGTGGLPGIAAIAPAGRPPALQAGLRRMERGAA